MAERTGGRGGFGRGRGDREGERGGRGGREGGRGGRRGPPEEEWIPTTKLGRLVKAGKIRSLEEIYLNAFPIKEPQIVDNFYKGEGGTTLKDDVMKVVPVQKQTRAGQRTRFKAFVVVGDENGHVGLGTKSSKEVPIAIREALKQAKLNMVPVRRGYWGNNIGLPHTVPAKVTGKCGSVIVRLVPAPRGSGIVAAPVSKKVIALAGVSDVYTQSRGCTRTMGNFVKATFAALSKTYSFLTPDLWPEARLAKDLYQEHTGFLKGSA